MGIEHHREDNIETTKITLSLAQKMVGILFVVVTSSISIGGTWYVFKSVTESRLAAAEIRLEKNANSIEAFESRGYPPHEARITKLETRIEDQQRTTSEINVRLTTLIAITERIERKLDK